MRMVTYLFEPLMLKVRDSPSPKLIVDASSSHPNMKTMDESSQNVERKLES